MKTKEMSGTEKQTDKQAEKQTDNPESKGTGVKGINWDAVDDMAERAARRLMGVDYHDKTKG